MTIPAFAILLWAMAQATAAPPPPPAPPAPPPAQRARAVADLGSLIGNGDYPTSALRNDEEGTVAFRLDVGTDGRVTGCTVTRSSGSEALDSATCRLMTARALFTPARYSLGRAAADRAGGKISWRLNTPWDLPFEPVMLIAEMRSTPTGDVTCWSQFNHDEAHPQPCGPELAAQLGGRARATNKAVEHSIVTRFTPAGAAPLADRGDTGGRGDPFLAIDALFSIGSNGAVLECRVTRSERIGPNAAAGAPPDVCRDYPVDTRLFQRAAAKGPPRSVSFEMRGYLRL
jgi:TonB family protein